MILLDTDVLLRALTHATEPAVQRQEVIAADLLRRLERGDAAAIAADAVLAEVAFILTAKKHD